MEYTSSNTERWELPVSISEVQRFAVRLSHAAPVTSDGQAYLANAADGPGEVVFEVKAADEGGISSFDAGARFLDVRDGLAPDKFTAEVRKVPAWPSADETQSASISWSEAIDGPYRTLWTYKPQLKWKDGELIDRTLRWPEVDRQVRNLPKRLRRVYVRYRIQGLAMDTPRLTAVRAGMHSRSPLLITHVWAENGRRRQRVERVGVGVARKNYEIEIPVGVAAMNEALILESLAEKR